MPSISDFQDNLILTSVFREGLLSHAYRVDIQKHGATVCAHVPPVSRTQTCVCMYRVPGGVKGKGEDHIANVALHALLPSTIRVHPGHALTESGKDRTTGSPSGTSSEGDWNDSARGERHVDFSDTYKCNPPTNFYAQWRAGPGILAPDPHLTCSNEASSVEDSRPTQVKETDDRGHYVVDAFGVPHFPPASNSHHHQYCQPPEPPSNSTLQSIKDLSAFGEWLSPNIFEGMEYQQIAELMKIFDEEDTGNAPFKLCVYPSISRAQLDYIAGSHDSLQTSFYAGNLSCAGSQNISTPHSDSEMVQSSSRDGRSCYRLTDNSVGPAVSSVEPSQMVPSLDRDLRCTSQDIPSLLNLRGPDQPFHHELPATEYVGDFGITGDWVPGPGLLTNDARSAIRSSTCTEGMFVSSNITKPSYGSYPPHFSSPFLQYSFCHDQLPSLNMTEAGAHTILEANLRSDSADSQSPSIPIHQYSVERSTASVSRNAWIPSTTRTGRGQYWDTQQYTGNEQLFPVQSSPVHYYAYAE
ncbi:hypothetical protein V5O48_001849 [Marasmius crinis-equi]|uniref:Uncharacterized protein n=1 Tax=Marasmius crinis-equi TaxID=585013 RepID=A0ABR3FXR7_9AGAR